MNKIKRFLHHLFIPQEGNNYRAKALHIDFLSCCFILLLILTFGIKLFAWQSGEILGFATDITVDKLFQLTNQQRQQNQLPFLMYNDRLTAAAESKANDMFNKNYWSHYGPDGETPWNFILNSGYQYEFAGENLAKNFLFSQGVIDAWMNSSSHRENILRQDYAEVGYAVKNGILNGEETTLIVQMFGKPLTAIITKESSEINNIEIPARTVAAEAPAIQEKPVIQKQSFTLAQNTSVQNKNFGLLRFNSNLIFILFLILALILDLYFATKLRIIRVTGKNLAHLIFIGFILAGLLLITKGSIL